MASQYHPAMIEKSAYVFDFVLAVSQRKLLFCGAYVCQVIPAETECSGFRRRCQAVLPMTCHPLQLSTWRPLTSRMSRAGTACRGVVLSF